MSVAAVTIALLIPTLLGYGAWLWIVGRPRGASAHLAAIGAGYLAGSMGLGALLSLAAGSATQTMFATLYPWLLVAGLLLAASGLRLAAPMTLIVRQGDAPVTRRERLLMILLCALLAIAAISLWRQAIALPALSWDAWNAWLAKSKGWYFQGRLVDVIATDAWLGVAPGSTITTAAAWYPEAMPRFALWLASASGGWNEPCIFLAWPLAWLALGFVVFGYLDVAGVRRVQALGTAAAILLLPLFTAHAALAGYADLWLAALLAIVVFHLHRWRRFGGWRDASMAALVTVLMLFVKIESAIWLLCLLAAVPVALLPRRWRVSLLLALPLIWLATLPFGGLRLPLPGLGVVRMAWGEIEIPAMGTMLLSWRPVMSQVMQTLFLLPNWSLLWYVAPVLLALCWRRVLQARELAPIGWFLVFGYAFLFVLFFLTDASAWAENLTSVNRVLMHVVPVTVIWLSLLWATPVSPDRWHSSRA